MARSNIFRSIMLSMLLLVCRVAVVAQEPPDCLKPKVWRTSSGEETHITFKTATGEKKLDLLALNPYQYEDLEAISIHSIYNTPVYKVDRNRPSTKRLKTIFGSQKTANIELLESQVSVIKEQKCYTIVIYGVEGVASMGAAMDTVLAFSSTIMVYDNLTGNLKATIEQEGVGNYNPKILANGAYLIAEVYPLNEYADQAVARIYSIENEELVYELGRCLDGYQFFTGAHFDTNYFMIAVKEVDDNHNTVERELNLVDPANNLIYNRTLSGELLKKYKGFSREGIRLLKNGEVKVFSIKDFFNRKKMSQR